VKHISSFFQLKQKDQKTVLLYRFHLMVILINLIAAVIDIATQRYQNLFVEMAIVLILSANVWFLVHKGSTEKVAYLFLATLATGLLILIHINHFATMSVVFILLIPLMTMLFIPFKYSLLLELLLFILMGVLLYVEYLENPGNPIVQNPMALFTLAYTAIIIYIFGLLYHLSIQYTFIELDEANLQKEFLLKEVHHRVKNNLNVISSIIGLQENTLEGKVKEELVKSKTRIESISLVHEMLYRHENFENIEFTPYMKRLSDLLFGMYGNEKGISVVIESDVETLPLTTMVQLGIMVNELLTNSIKYAFEEENGQIEISLGKEDDGYLLTYSDDGIGYENPEALLKSKSLGVKLVYLTSKQLKGSLEISSPKGLKYEMRFK